MNLSINKCGFALAVVLALMSAQSSDTLIDKAIGLYESRHLNAENLTASFELLKGLVETEPENLRANYELSKVYYLLGDKAGVKSEKLELYNKGKEYGKKAIKIDANSAWAHLWYMVNLGRTGQVKGVLNSLSLVPEIKKEIDRVLKLDPKNIPALDARAMLYYELPGLLGGDLNKSIGALKRALELDSNYSLIFVDMGKVMIKKKDYEKARWFLNKVAEIQVPTYEADHVLDDKPDAAKLLKEIEGK